MSNRGTPLNPWVKLLRTIFSKTTEEHYFEATPSDEFFDPLTIIPSGPVEFQSEEDDRVCEICDPLDGNQYDFDDPTKPLIPLHPNCRCHYIYVDTGEHIHFRGSEYEGM
jgi:hypothetical protein